MILADCLQVAALLQQRVHRVLHEPKVKSTAHLVATSRLAAQQLGAGNVDDVDSARGDEHSFLPRIFLVDAMKCVFEVFDRAEEDAFDEKAKDNIKTILKEMGQKMRTVIKKEEKKNETAPKAN